MHLFPAIDLYEGKAVRLYKGDYAQMTVYSEDPLAVAQAFSSDGARFIHIVDLEGAKTGLTPNLAVIKRIVDHVDLFVEVGGGIRNMETVKAYLDIGVDRVILGTAAVNDPDFLALAVANSAIGDEALKKIRDLIKWCATWVMKISLYIFTGYMSITGAITGSADAAALKITKSTISLAVPVIGNILS